MKAATGTNGAMGCPPFSARLPTFMRYFWGAVLITALCLCLGWAETWEGIRAAAANVHAVSADFTQEKHLPILAKPLISKGRLYYRRPDSLRWEYTSPVRSVLLMHGGEARRFVQTDRGMVEDAGVRLQAMQFVMPEIGKWLAGQFQDSPLFKASLKAPNRILLVPTDPGMARFIQRIELVLAKRPGVIKEVLIYESDDAYTRMVFSHTKVNPHLDDRLFKEVR
jgi:outer membrane lipoprotein-sorting protein